MLLRRHKKEIKEVKVAKKVVEEVKKEVKKGDK